MLLNRHIALGAALVVILGLILIVSSCSPFQQNPATTSPESGGHIPSEPATSAPPTDEKTADFSYPDPNNSANQAEVNNSTLSITPIEEIHITGIAPEVDIAQYRLTIDGLVDTEVALDYDTLLKYPTVTDVVLLVCPGFFTDNAEWTGVPVTTLLAEAGIKPEASQFVFYAIDGYQRIFSIDEIQRDGVFLAHTVNGQVLPKEHGFPVRLVVTGELGYKWVKWVERIEVR